MRGSGPTIGRARSPDVEHRILDRLSEFFSKLRRGPGLGQWMIGKKFLTNAKLQFRDQQPSIMALNIDRQTKLVHPFTIYRRRVDWGTAGTNRAASS
jgi:hypothetical protein